MTLKYYFGENEYEFDLNSSQIKEYFKAQPNRVLKRYLEEAFDNMTKKEQAEIITELSDDPTRLMKRREGYNITYIPNFEQLLDDDEDWCIETFLFDNLDQYEDELKQWYEDDAREEASQGSAREERESEYRSMVTPAGGWN